MVYEYKGHGLAIESEIALPGLPQVAHRSGPADLTVTWRRSGDPGMPEPAGSPVAVFQDHVGDFEAHRSDDGSYVLRFGDVCRAEIDTTGSSIVVHNRVPVSASVPWIVVGACVSFALTVRGVLTLHASAVAFDGIAQVLVAPRGFGKSLAAALACANGADLLTDDMCAVATQSGTWVVAPGTNVLRLRTPVEATQRLFPGRELEVSSDGRTLLTMPALEAPVPIARIVFVVPDRTLRSAAIVDVPSDEALLACLGNLRTPGLRDNLLLGPQFEQAADLLATIPAVTLRVPPAPDVGDIGRHLYGRVGVHQY